MSIFSFLKDEKDKLSTARTLLFIWSLFFFAVVFIRPAALTPEFYGVMSTIIIALVGWSGGPRVMQYLSPALGNITQKFKKEDVTATTEISDKG